MHDCLGCETWCFLFQGQNRHGKGVLQQSAEENVLSWKDEVKEEGDSNVTRNREFKLYVVYCSD